MKINLFYKIGDYYGSYPKPILYAYTDNIEFAKEFRKTRRKDMFIEKEIKCDREEFYKLSLKQPNSLLLQSNVMSKNDNAFKGFDIVPSSNYKVTIPGSDTIVSISDHDLLYADLVFDFDAVVEAKIEAANSTNE